MKWCTVHSKPEWHYFVTSFLQKRETARPSDHFCTKSLARQVLRTHTAQQPTGQLVSVYPYWILIEFILLPQLHYSTVPKPNQPPTTMAEYGVEEDVNENLNNGEDEEMHGDDQEEEQYNDYGAEEDDQMGADVPVTQEDAWAVIS